MKQQGAFSNTSKEENESVTQGYKEWNHSFSSAKTMMGRLRFDSSLCNVSAWRLMENIIVVNQRY